MPAFQQESIFYNHSHKTKLLEYCKSWYFGLLPSYFIQYCKSFCIIIHLKKFLTDLLEFVLGIPEVGMLPHLLDLIEKKTYSLCQYTIVYLDWIICVTEIAEERYKETCVCPHYQKDPILFSQHFEDKEKKWYILLYENNECYPWFKMEKWFVVRS